MAIGTVLEQDWLKQAQGTAYSLPATMYLALSTTEITTGVGGATGNLTEVSGGAYARIAIASSSTNWTVSSSTYPSVVSNAIAQAFAQATASWGTVVSWALMDASTAGNILFYGRLSKSQTDPFDGTGAQTAFTTTLPVSGDLTVDAVTVKVGTSTQIPFSAYGIEWNASGTVTINFTTAPASGTGNVTLTYQTPSSQAVPSGGNFSFPVGDLQFGLY